MAEYSHNLTLKPSHVFHHWESHPDVNKTSSFVFDLRATPGQPFGFVRDLAGLSLAKFEILWQRPSSASFDLTPPSSRGDIFS